MRPGTGALGAGSKRPHLPLLVVPLDPRHDVLPRRRVPMLGLSVSDQQVGKRLSVVPGERSLAARAMQREFGHASSLVRMTKRVVTRALLPQIAVPRKLDCARPGWLAQAKSDDPDRRKRKREPRSCRAPRGSLALAILCPVQSIVLGLGRFAAMGVEAIHHDVGGTPADLGNAVLGVTYRS